jgi:hypothetical protein
VKSVFLISAPSRNDHAAPVSGDPQGRQYRDHDENPGDYREALLVWEWHLLDLKRITTVLHERKSNIRAARVLHRLRNMLRDTPYINGLGVTAD